MSARRAAPILASEVLELPDALEAVEGHFRAQGWTDGLPIVPPTEARVEAMPVLVAALEAMLEPAFNLYGVQATTHPVAPLLIVHGPAAARLLRRVAQLCGRDTLAETADRALAAVRHDASDAGPLAADLVLALATTAE